MDAACQIDCGADVTDNDNDISHDSDDTIILQKEIEELQGLSVPFACVGSGDPVRVLRLYTTNTLDIL